MYEEVLEHCDFVAITKSHNKENLILGGLESTDYSGNQRIKVGETKISNDLLYKSESLLWFKLYLEEYLRKIQTKLKLNKSQR